jgi:hypothetical protein
VRDTADCSLAPKGRARDEHNERKAGRKWTEPTATGGEGVAVARERKRERSGDRKQQEGERDPVRAAEVRAERAEREQPRQCAADHPPSFAARRDVPLRSRAGNAREERNG